MYFLSLKFNVRKHLFISGILYPLAIRCDLNSVSFFSNSDMLFVYFLSLKLNVRKHLFISSPEPKAHR